MFATSYPSDSAENVSDLALELLDEMRIRLMECRLVLQALPDHADMNFDELEKDLHVAAQGAHNAYGAASLVHQGATMDARWGAGWSRPKAIFARHGAAVRAGATKIPPASSVGDRMEQALWQLPPADRIQNFAGPRPRCVATLRSNDLQCTSPAVYLGSGSFGNHCYTHAGRYERDQHRTHLDEVAAAQSELHDELLDRLRHVCNEVSERWIESRANRQQWADQLEAAMNR